MDQFQARYGGKSEQDFKPLVDLEISSNMELMQIQPEIMQTYRRYVVLTNQADPNTLKEEGYCGVSAPYFGHTRTKRS
jgi:hypothetical protein